MIILVDYTIRFPGFTIPFFIGLKNLTSNTLLIGSRKLFFPLIFFKMIVTCFFYRKVTVITSDLYFPNRLKWLELEIFRFLKRTAKVKIHHIVHNLSPHESIPYKVEMIYMKYYTLCDKLIVLSETTRNNFIDKENVILLSHGLDYRNQSKSGYKVREKLELLIFGHLRRYKGIVPFIRLINNIQNVHLIVAGKCNDKSLDEEIGSIVSSSENISYYNTYLESSELNMLIQSSDVVVFPYLKITTSGAIFKALEHDKIIVTSDLPYFNELKDKGLVNYCFRADQIDSLKDFLDSTRLKTWNEKRNLAHLSWANIAKIYIDEASTS